MTLGDLGTVILVGILGHRETEHGNDARARISLLAAIRPSFRFVASSLCTIARSSHRDTRSTTTVIVATEQWREIKRGHRLPDQRQMGPIWHRRGPPPYGATCLAIEHGFSMYPGLRLMDVLASGNR